MLEESVEDGARGRDIADEFAPVLNGSVACHDRGAEFIAAHNDLEKIFSGLVWKLFKAHVVDNEQIAFEIFVEAGIGFEGDFGLLEVPDDIEDGAVDHGITGLDRGVTDGLGQMCFASSRRADEKEVVSVADKLTGGQFKKGFPFDVGVELPVEILQRFEVPEVGFLQSSLHFPVLSGVEFVIDQQFEEVVEIELIGPGLLQPEFKVCKDSGKAEFLEFFEKSVTHKMPPWIE